jgi:hypothetical protein
MERGKAGGMTPHIKNELDTLYGMVVNWRKDYERHVDPAGGNDFLVSDFIGEIEEHLYPYLRRIRECGYITDSEFSDFFEKCYAEVTIFREGIVSAAG